MLDPFGNHRHCHAQTRSLIWWSVNFCLLAALVLMQVNTGFANWTVPDDVIVNGQHGANGANGAPGTTSSPGGDGQPGGNGESATAISHHPFDSRNTATAVGGKGGNGGNGGNSVSPAFLPGLGGQGGNGGDAIADALVTSGPGFREAISLATGGNGGDGGLGGMLFQSQNRTTSGIGGHGGHATANATANSVSGAVSISGTARAGNAGGSLHPAGNSPSFGGNAWVSLWGSATSNIDAFGLAVGGRSGSSSGPLAAGNGGNANISGNLISQGSINATLRSEGGWGGNWWGSEVGAAVGGDGGNGTIGPVSISFGTSANISVTSVGGRGGHAYITNSQIPERGGRGGDASLTNAISVNPLLTASSASLNQTAEAGAGGSGRTGGAGGDAVSIQNYALSLTNELNVVSTSRGGAGGSGDAIGGVGGSAIAEAHALNLIGKARSDAVAIGGVGGFSLWGGSSAAGGAATAAASAEGSTVSINVSAIGGNGASISDYGNAGAGGNASISSITGIGNIVNISALVEGGRGGTVFDGGVAGAAGQASLGIITGIGNRITIDATAKGGNGGRAYGSNAAHGANVVLNNRLQYVGSPSTTLVSLTQTAVGGHGGDLYDWGGAGGDGGRAESVLQVIGGQEAINLTTISRGGFGGTSLAYLGFSGGAGRAGTANSIADASSTGRPVNVSAQAFGGNGGGDLYSDGARVGGNATATATANSISNTSAVAVAAGGRGGRDWDNQRQNDGDAQAVANATSTRGIANATATATGHQVLAEAGSVGRQAWATATASGHQGTAKSTARATPLASRWLFTESLAQANLGSTARTLATASAQGVVFNPAQGDNYEAFSFSSTNLSAVDTIARVGNHQNIAAVLGIDMVNQTMSHGAVGIADFGGRFASDGTPGEIYSRTNSGAFFWDRTLPSEKTFYVGLFDGREEGSIDEWNFTLAAPDAGFLANWSSINDDWGTLFEDNVFTLEDFDPSNDGVMSLFWSLSWLTDDPDGALFGSVTVFVSVPEPSTGMVCLFATMLITTMTRRRSRVAR